jgi:hypothetical protein
MEGDFCLNDKDRAAFEYFYRAWPDKKRADNGAIPKS